MIVALDVVIFLTLLATAVLALHAKDRLAAVSLLAAYSLFTALLFAGVSAVDVALVEAALGAGVTGVLFIAAILATARRSDVPSTDRRLIVLPLLVAFIAVMLFASTGLPDRGDPDAPAKAGVSQTYLADSLADTQTPNVVTALLADYRSLDTLGETMVIVTAALAAALVLARQGEVPTWPQRRGGADPGGRDRRTSADPAGPAPDAGSATAGDPGGHVTPWSPASDAGTDPDGGSDRQGWP